MPDIIAPSPAFAQACRQVLGIDALLPSIGAAMAIRSGREAARRIAIAHERIVRSRAAQLADEAVSELDARLRGGRIAFTCRADAEQVARAWREAYEAARQHKEAAPT